MHELTVTKSIHTIVQRHTEKGRFKRVVSVTLAIGVLSDIQAEWMQKYFDRLSRGSVLEGAKLKITRIPAVFVCNQCQHSFEITSLLKEDLFCRNCRVSNIRMVSGREYKIINMEVI